MSKYQKINGCYPIWLHNLPYIGTARNETVIAWNLKVGPINSTWYVSNVVCGCWAQECWFYDSESVCWASRNYIYRVTLWACWTARDGSDRHCVRAYVCKVRCYPLFLLSAQISKKACIGCQGGTNHCGHVAIDTTTTIYCKIWEVVWGSDVSHIVHMSHNCVCITIVLDDNRP